MHVRKRLQAFGVESGYLLAAREQVRDPIQLRHAEGAPNLIEPVVVAEAFVFKPRSRLAPSLIPEAPQPLIPRRIAGHDHPPLAGSHLLIGIERKDGSVAEFADLAAIPLCP